MHTPTNEWDTCKFSSFLPGISASGIGIIDQAVQFSLSLSLPTWFDEAFLFSIKFKLELLFAVWQRKKVYIVATLLLVPPCSTIVLPFEMCLLMFDDGSMRLGGWSLHGS